MADNNPTAVKRKNILLIYIKIISGTAFAR
jgi:hypothetical protein